jgi:hypothetical protein
MTSAGNKPLPLPLRLAAGLVATAVEQAMDLPRLVVEFPVTAVSQALQASMRVQQKVTELAIKGDRALGTLRPVEEKPSWATFDEDEPRRNGRSSVTELRRQPPAEPEEPDTTTAEVAAAVTARATRANGTPLPATDEKPRSAPTSGPDLLGAPETDTPAPADGGPNALPGYAGMTIPQLRARLRRLDAADLRALLEWETAHDNRPAYVTMLSNRITTVSGG